MKSLKKKEGEKEREAPMFILGQNRYPCEPLLLSIYKTRNENCATETRRVRRAADEEEAAHIQIEFAYIQ